MKKLFRYVRLLPVVVILGSGLLVLKGVDIARAAQAAASADPDQPDNSGLAPTDNGGKPAPDYANDDTTTGSAGEVDVLSSLTRRRAELDARERALNMRENLLNAGEGRVDQKIAALKDLQAQIQALLAQRDDKQKAQIAALVKSYGPDGMPAKKAAGIFNTMPDEVLIPIAQGMKPGDLGQILSNMNPEAAQKLTVRLASLLKLPETAPAAICPAPTTTADAMPTMNPPVTPLQTASLNPVVTPLPPAPSKPAPVKPAAPKPATASAAPPAKLATTTPAAAATTPAKPTPTPPASAAPTALAPPAPVPAK